MESGLRRIHGGLGPQRIEGKTMRWLHQRTSSPCPFKLVESEPGLPVDLNEHGITTSRSNVLASRHRPISEGGGRRLLDRRPPRALDFFEPALPTDANVQASIVVQTDGWKLLVWNGWCRAFVGLGIWRFTGRLVRIKLYRGGRTGGLGLRPQRTPWPAGCNCRTIRTESPCPHNNSRCTPTGLRGSFRGQLSPLLTD